MKNSEVAAGQGSRGADIPPYPGTPRWVYGFGVIVIVPIVVFLIRHVVAGGFHGHGP